MGCSKNLKRRQRFYLHINQSGQPDLTFGKYTGTKNDLKVIVSKPSIVLLRSHDRYKT